METLFERLLREKIGLMKDMVIQGVIETGCDDFPDYRYNLGYLKALSRVLDAMEATNDEIRKDR